MFRRIRSNASGIKKRRKRSFIAVTDSGAGGVAVLRKLKSDFCDLNFLYVSDCASVPYGNKTKSEIEALCEKNIKKAIFYGAVAIVVACNTMSRAGKNVFLKSGVPCFFVEPDFSFLNGEDKNAGNCAVFCTEATSSDEKFAELKKNEKCSVFPQKTLAAQIEKKLTSRNKRKSCRYKSHCYNIDFSANENFCPLLVKYVFLSCTHYIHIKNEFSKIFKNAKIYDGTEKLRGEISEFLTYAETIKKNREKKGNECSESRLAGGKIKFAGSGKNKMKRLFFKTYR